MTLDFNVEVKVKLHRSWTVYIQSEGEVSPILDPNIGQRVWSASSSGSVAVYRPPFPISLSSCIIKAFKIQGEGNFSNAMI